MKHGHPDPIQLTLLHQRMKSYCGSNRNNQQQQTFCQFLSSSSSFLLSFSVCTIVADKICSRFRSICIYRHHHHHHSSPSQTSSAGHFIPSSLFTHSLSVLSLFDRIVTLCSVRACVGEFVFIASNRLFVCLLHAVFHLVFRDPFALSLLSSPLDDDY